MILTAEGRERIDRFLARKLPEHSRTKLAQFIAAGGVAVDGEVVLLPRFELKPGQSVTVGDVPESEPHDLTPVPMDLDVVHEDADLLVVNKPRGLTVHPAPSQRTPTLVNALLARSHDLSTTGGSFRPGIVHRLDKETTGLLIVAKNDRAHVDLSEQIRSKTAERRYFAIVQGRPSQDSFAIDAPLGRHPGLPSRMTMRAGGRPSKTFVRRLREVPSGCLLALRLATGRTHQIRVHLAGVGLPVLGDNLYAPKDLHEHALQLHAAYLEFTHPSSLDRVAVYAPPPADFLDEGLAARADLEGEWK